MSRVDRSGVQGGNAVAEKRVDFTYDNGDQFNTITRYNNVAGTQTVAGSSYTFDETGRLTALTHTKGQTTLADYDWTFDAASRMTAMDFDYGGNNYASDYTNDAADQLTAVDHDYQADETYVYDDNGNRTNNGFTVGTNNRLLTDGTYRYTYDAEGNRTHRFVDADSSGTLNAGDTDIMEYEWDYRNRLVSVTARAAYGGDATKVVEQSYDYRNRWVKRSVDPDGAGEQSSTSTYFVYDGNQIALQFDGSAMTDLSHRYTWGPNVDQILSDEQLHYDSGEEEFVTDTVLWPLTDHLNTVRNLITYDSQEDETTIANHRVYNAFGKITSETNSNVACLFTFTARPFDETTDLQNNLNRWYDPTTGRWLSEDPIGFDAEDANLYRYVSNKPVNSIDPMGLQGGAVPGYDFDPMLGGLSITACCGEQPYNPAEECCEDEQVVGKVPIWICERALANNPGWAMFGTFQRPFFPYWLDVEHTYVCCAGANLNCYGMQARQPDGTNTLAGDPIPPETMATGDCVKRMVCPDVKSQKCDNPTATHDYSNLWHNCHDCAWDNVW